MSGSGLPVEPVYDDSQLTDFQSEEALGRPGEYPFTRGVYPRRRVARAIHEGGRTVVGVNKVTADHGVLYPRRDALRAGATLGEVCDALREVRGVDQPEII